MWTTDFHASNMWKTLAAVLRTRRTKIRDHLRRMHRQQLLFLQVFLRCVCVPHEPVRLRRRSPFRAERVTPIKGTGVGSDGCSILSDDDPIRINSTIRMSEVAVPMGKWTLTPLSGDYFAFLPGNDWPRP